MIVSRRKFWPVILLAAVCLLNTPGCDSDVVEVNSADPELVAATFKARDSVDEFIEAVNNAQPKQQFAIKARFENEEHAESVWLFNVRHADEKFTGTIANEPVKLRELRYGQQHSIPVDEIMDWAVIDADGTRHGAFTERVFEKRERAR